MQVMTHVNQSEFLEKWKTFIKGQKKLHIEKLPFNL